MLTTIRSRALLQLSRRGGVVVPTLTSSSSSIRSYATDQPLANDPQPAKKVPNVSKTNETPIEWPNQDKWVSETVQRAEELRVSQAPNRKGVWSRSQNPRERAMSGPRFEQTIMELQPAPQAAIDLIHQQPVRFLHERVAVCDGGGGPLGHPRVYINLDKAQINPCEYCGLPFANEHHRAALEALPETSYPLAPKGNAAEVGESQRITNEALGQR